MSSTQIDHDCDCVYINLGEPRFNAVETTEVAPGIMFDWNERGELMGIEFLSIDAWRGVASEIAVSRELRGLR